MTNKDKGLVGRLHDGIKAVGKKALPYFLAANTLAFGFGSAKHSYAQTFDKKYTQDSVAGEVYGPPTPKEFYENTSEKKEKPAFNVHKIDMDSLTQANPYDKFRVSMNQMDDTREKREIIMKYVLTLHPEVIEKNDPGLLNEIETLDVGNWKDRDRLDKIFRDVFFYLDPDKGTYENEFLTQTIPQRVEYADNVQRSCFHASNKGLSTLTPVWNMIDYYGWLIASKGIPIDEDSPFEGGDMLGSSRDKEKPTRASSSDEKLVRFKTDPSNVFHRLIRTPYDPYWRKPLDTPEAVIAPSWAATDVNSNDPIPELKEGDVDFYFVSEPDEQRTRLYGTHFLRVNLKPFIEKQKDGTKSAKLESRQYIYGPNDSLVYADTSFWTIGNVENPDSLESNGRNILTIQSKDPFYMLGDEDGWYRHAIEIFTRGDKPKKQSDGGKFGVDIERPVPTHFGYVTDEYGEVMVPPLGQIGDSLEMTFYNHLESNDPRVSKPVSDSLGRYNLEYIVSAYEANNREGQAISGKAIDDNVLQFLLSKTLVEGKIPSTYTIPIMQKIKGKSEYFDEDIVFFRDSTFVTSPEEIEAIQDLLSPSKTHETAVLVDTLYGYMRGVTGRHKITVPLPDSVFEDGKQYNFRIDVNPKNHRDRMSPKGFITSDSLPISYQKGVVKNVKIVKKIPNK